MSDLKIKSLPSAEPEKRTEERTETHACDSISRQAAIDAIQIGWDYTNDQIRALQRLPSAQPDIIACGDCIHWICHDRRCGYWNHGVKPLDWCCHAERRTDE